jgi:CopA family copper-resistance protein
VDRSRRRFVRGIVVGGALTACASRGILRSVAEGANALEAPQATRALVGTGAPLTPGSGGSVLHGTEFDLTVAELAVNFTGARRVATAINGLLPGPTLRWREGDLVTVRVANRLAVPTSIHWHGVIVPADMDGVPGVSFPGVAPGQTFTYRFRVNQSGTYWYHSHSRFQEQTGTYGAIVIDPRAGDRHHIDREHTIFLSDWTDIDPEHLYRTLKLRSDYFNFGKRTASDFVADARQQGLGEALSDRRMWGAMRMDPTDLADVSAYAYTYLMNGVAPAGNWTGLFQRGERVRLRLINGSSMSFFDVRIPGLKLNVVAADGQDIAPVTVDELRVGGGEVFDVIIEPDADHAYSIFAQSVDRSGYAAGTLAPRLGMKADVPHLDPRPLLTMADMGMAHDETAGTDHGAMAGMDHEATAGAMNMPNMRHDMPGMRHDGSSPPADGTALAPPSLRSPVVDNLAAQPQPRLDDPGVGLRGNGRRVLTYADLHTIGGPFEERPPDREIVLHLTGHMQRFIWSFDGQKFSEAEPLRFRYGERIALTLINDSMMLHPIHLHGMWGEVYTPDGTFLVRKHTITVQPGQKLTYRVTADALGTWAYHCHLLYHMEAGMFREVIVERDSQEPSTPHAHHSGHHS